MQISSRFTIAIHIFACIDAFAEDRKVTSDFLASSICVNPVVVRRLLSQLKGAGLVAVQRGSGGASIARPLEEVTLFDVYLAVGCVDHGELFHFHEQPNQDCPVGRNIHRILDGKLRQVQKAMEDELRKITLADVMEDARRCLAEESRQHENRPEM